MDFQLPKPFKKKNLPAKCLKNTRKRILSFCIFHINSFIEYTVNAHFVYLGYVLYESGYVLYERSLNIRKSQIVPHRIRDLFDRGYYSDIIFGIHVVYRDIS